MIEELKETKRVICMTRNITKDILEKGNIEILEPKITKIEMKHSLKCSTDLSRQNNQQK